MALVVADRLLETSTTTGAGTYALAGAVTGHRAFSAACANNDTVEAFVEEVDANGVPSGGWEVGTYTWGTGGNLARTSIVASSNANAAVSWAAGTRRIGVGLTAARLTALMSGGSGLTNWVESLSMANPNGTVSAARFIPTSAQAQTDAVVSAKGTGALLAQLPDNGTTGGNKRNTYCVDWQMVRGANTQVANGVSAAIGGGQNNTASGDQSCIPGGDSNTASGQYSFAAGRLNTASSQAAYSLGLNNVSSAIASGVLGQLNLADANNALATGLQASTRGIEGAMVRSGGQFSAKGDAQKGDYVLRASTTDATPTVLRTNGSTAGTANQVVLPNASTFKVRVVAVARSSTNSIGFSGEGVISRGANAASTAVNATITLTAMGATGGVAWTCTATADTTNGALAITATGAAATNIKWVAFVETVEIVG